jgi:hypothetical protein
MIGVAETHPGRHPTAARCADSVLAETPVLILWATCRTGSFSHTVVVYFDYASREPVTKTGYYR